MPDEDLDEPPKEPPAGYRFAEQPPSAEVRTFSKQPSAADEFVGCKILYNWGAPGWHIGTIVSRNQDKRVKRGGEPTNFYVHYEIDDETPPTAFGLAMYDGNEAASWVLLEAL